MLIMPLDICSFRFLLKFVLVCLCFPRLANTFAFLFVSIAHRMYHESLDNLLSVNEANRVTFRYIFSYHVMISCSKHLGNL